MELLAEQRELLAQLLENEGITPSKPRKISLRRPDDELRLSFAQERLWLLDQIEPDNTAYTVARFFTLNGPLNAAALEQSINDLVLRHESLRTTFTLKDNHPVQVIAPFVPSKLKIVDLTPFDEVEREPRMRELATKEVQIPFDLAQGPLFRTTLLRLADQSHALFLTMHHIVSDGWSLSVLGRELSRLYEAHSLSQSLSLPELPLQYADFAIWQRAQLEGAAMEESQHYWMEQLAGAPLFLNLPTDHASPRTQSYRGGLLAFSIDDSLATSLKQIGSKEQSTFFMTLLAAFAVLLSRYTQEDDILIGSPIAGRNYPEVEPLIGFFVNTLILRIDLSGDPTFCKLLQRVRETCLGAYGQQDVPFERLVEQLAPERNLSHSPIFQVMFGWQDILQEEFRVGELTFKTFDVDRGSSKFALSMMMKKTPNGLDGVISYSTDLFEEDRMRRMEQHWMTLLRGIAAAPGSRLSDLPLLTSAEQDELLFQANATARDFEQEPGVHKLFERQVALNPDATAVVFEDQSLTYGGLNAQANQLARYLQTFDVGPESTIGLCLERSLELMVALLGILKAGAAYLPLDPTAPKERLSYMIDEADVSLILTQQRIASALPSSETLVLRWELIQNQVSQQPQGNLSTINDKDQLANVIFTSGSTGKPKCIQVTHRALTNLLCSVREEPGLTSDDVFLSITNLSFDIAALELFLPLIVGAKLEIAGRDVVVDGKLLKEKLSSSGATVLQATPSNWQMLLEADWSGADRLKALCGGEALSRDLADALLPRVESLWNMYGPTETTIWSTTGKVEAEGPIFLGHAIANTKIYLLDGNQNLVPVGIPGEIHIGGDGVARGYINRPDLSSEKFIANRFGTDPGERLYRTGDLAQFLPDGQLEYLGRRDNQIKLRGYRIELGEIESTLRQHDSVRDAAVVVQEHSASDRRLVAFVIAEEGVEVNQRELRDFLKQLLPDYMLPSAIDTLAEFPLTPNGKLDRKYLQELRSAPTIGEEPEEREATAPEEIIAAIWSETLNLPRVGLDENFFDLGGHSLLGMQVIGKIKELLQVDIPLRVLFEAPTVVQFAHAVISHEARPGQTEKIAAVWRRINKMSAAEARELLDKQRE